MTIQIIINKTINRVKNSSDVFNYQTFKILQRLETYITRIKNERIPIGAKKDNFYDASDMKACRIEGMTPIAIPIRANKTL
ncbi:hypothetical protein [uncultured Formosa sp.]|uniref:hypothetical protein n=1 Tax=uncultured Formosa sp. TaxID=255435 RepID=UPI00263925E5|nr:hypothetical protein [uncultured Formosa sp.]